MGLRVCGWLVAMFLACSPPMVCAEVVYGRAARPGSQGTFDFNSDGRNDFTIGTKLVSFPPDALAIHFAIEQPSDVVEKNGVLTEADTVPAIDAGFQIGPDPLLFSWDDSFSYRNIPGISPVDALLYLPAEPVTQFIGIRFHTGDGLHYGWIQFARGSWAPYDMNHPDWPNEIDPWLPNPFDLPRIDTFGAGVIDWAYESTPGAPIVAGAVPEAGTVVLGVVGAGVALVVGWRRRGKPAVTMTNAEARMTNQ